ncbi:MAG: hypothetical protein KDA60_17830 [Planctomycetales bacterium]|nr:hypothetical protein [Planctomycetales bacterium]
MLVRAVACLCLLTGGAVALVSLTSPAGADQDEVVFDNDSPSTQRNIGIASAEAGTTEEPRRELFEGWQRPEVALFLTGRQHGYIEPCGCTGLENAKGGLSRRHFFLTQLRKSGWDVVPLDVGNQVERFGRQAELKFQTTTDILRAMQYQAVGFGPDDMRLSVDELLPSILGNGEDPPMFVSANVEILDPELTPRFRVIQAGGKRIGVTSILGLVESRAINSDNVRVLNPTTALQQVLPKLQQSRCDLLVLLAHTDLDATRKLATQFPMFHVIVTAGGAGEPTLDPEVVAGTQIIQVGTKGMYVGVVGVFNDNRTPLRYERVPLDGRFSDSDKVLELFAAYQQQLKVLGLSGLGLKPVPYPSAEPRRFVGHAACADCHTEATAVFEDTDHAHATESIAKPSQRAAIPRHFDPECLSCHVTGWNPQEYFPYISGYLDYTASAELHSNGCENCHGPGSLHVAAENGDIDVSEEKIEQYREEMRLTLEQARKTKCAECHDLDNSPDFHHDGAFEEYWEKVKHEGKD